MFEKLDKKKINTKKEKKISDKTKKNKDNDKKSEKEKATVVAPGENKNLTTFLNIRKKNVFHICSQKAMEAMLLHICKLSLGSAIIVN